MSDTTGFLAGCATTGMAVLLLLVARVGLEESLPAVPTGPNIVPDSEILPPVPVPSPPEAVQERSDNFDQLFQRDLERQRDLLERLETQLANQRLLVRDLEDQLDQQQTETATIVAQLKEYKSSMDTLAEQQVRSAELSQLAASGDGPTAIVWVGAGVALVLIFGSGLVLIILIIMTAQNRRRARRNAQITHPFNVTPSYGYYEQEFLPPQIPPRQAGQYEPFDYGG